MERKKTILVIIVLLSIIFITTLIFTYYLSPISNTTSIYPVNSIPTDEVLGNADYGNVIKEGPYGNVNSNVKIAYIVGVHPQESNAHQAIIESIKTAKKSLKYCYYIYKVNVTVNAQDYNQGRMNGQLLAKDYAVPDIINHNFNLAIDIHSNVGNWDENRFIFTPSKESKSEYIANTIIEQLPWLTYYAPPNPTSPSYITEPLLEAGIPAIIYETYYYDSYNIIKKHADEFVKTVDKITL